MKSLFALLISVSLLAPAVALAQSPDGTDGGTTRPEPVSIEQALEPVAEPAPTPTEGDTAGASATTSTPVAETQSPAPAATAEPAANPADVPSAVAPSETDTALAIPNAETVEEVQEVFENIAQAVPAATKNMPGVIASTLGACAFVLALWEMRKRMVERKTHKCARCDAVKEVSSGTPCGNCEGSGTVTLEKEITIACRHCKGEGEDPCHHCDGLGKALPPGGPRTKETLGAAPSCEFCSGTGQPKVEDGEDPVVCCDCQGKKEITVSGSIDVPCPVCRGKG